MGVKKTMPKTAACKCDPCECCKCGDCSCDPCTCCQCGTGCCGTKNKSNDEVTTLKINKGDLQVHITTTNMMMSKKTFCCTCCDNCGCKLCENPCTCKYPGIGRCCTGGKCALNGCC